MDSYEGDDQEGYDKWRLYAGDQLLGSDNMDESLKNMYGEEFSRNISYANTSFDLNRGQDATYQSFRKELSGTVDSLTGYYVTPKVQALYDKYGVASGTEIAFSNKSQDELYGWDPDVEDVKEHFTDFYGTAEGFQEPELSEVYDRVYGEVTPNMNMGLGWMDMYHTFNKWEQEDAMWNESMLGLQNELFPAAFAQQRAKMAAGGMEQGSEQWERSLQGIESQRVDVEAESAERKVALENTSIYKSLMGEYESMKDTAEMRGIEKTGTAYEDVIKFVEATEKYTGPKYGYDSETNSSVIIREGYWTYTPEYYATVSSPYEYTYTEGVETGNLAYGSEADPSVAASFDEFYQSQFGAATGVTDPYEAVTSDISNQPESESDRQARMAASGTLME